MKCKYVRLSLKPETIFKTMKKACMERQTVEKKGTQLRRYILSRLGIQSDITF
jgi:hypothetical protein